ncbi:hypothetical protein CBL_05708 [Carabus blaptoides fortunei]
MQDQRSSGGEAVPPLSIFPYSYERCVKVPSRNERVQYQKSQTHLSGEESSVSEDKHTYSCILKVVRRGAHVGSWTGCVSVQAFTAPRVTPSPKYHPESALKDVGNAASARTLLVNPQTSDKALLRHDGLFVLKCHWLAGWMEHP